MPSPSSSAMASWGAGEASLYPGAPPALDADCSRRSPSSPRWVHYSGVSLAARAASEVLADMATMHGGPATPLDRERVAYHIGLGRADKLAPVLAELEAIGFLTIRRGGTAEAMGKRSYRRDSHGRRVRDQFSVSLYPPPDYVGPVDLPHADVQFALDRDAAYAAAKAANRSIRTGNITIRRSAPDHLPSYVYVIGTPGSSKVKIGVSSNIDVRIRALQASSPAPLVVLWCARATRTVEQLLHQQFQRCRVHGEWFDFGGTTSPVPRIRQAALRLGAKEAAA